MRFILILAMMFQFSSSFSAGIIKNNGQINTSVLYYSAFNNHSVYFLKDKISFVTQKKVNGENRLYRFDMIPNEDFNELRIGNIAKEKIHFIKNGKTITTDVFHSIHYVGKNFDLIFYDDPRNGLKYDIVLKSKKDVSFSFEGIEKITKDKNIKIHTSIGETELMIPLSYSDSNNGNYIVRNNFETQIKIENNRLIFTAPDEEFDVAVIDPWTSFAGGTDIDEAYGVAFDADSNMYISGYTSSTDFPTSTGVIQTSLDDMYDAFVFKFNPSGDRIWATYYGGSANDFGQRITVDNNNQPIFTGYTYSNDLLVSSSGTFSNTFSGIFDAFILKLNADGTFDRATYYGGTGGEFVTDIDYFNNEIVIGGFTSSSDLPLSGTGFQNTQGGALDIFVAKFDNNLNRIWDTYYGGNNSEDAHTITFDKSGNIILAGDSWSSNFPVSTNAYQNTYTALSDAVLVKFDNNGQRLWATFLGGISNEDIEGISTDANDNIYFSGYSTGNDLPISGGAFQSTNNGDRELIIGSFSPGGNLRWLTYLGGTGWDMPKDLVVNSGGKVMITGESYSSNFPEVGATFQTGNAGNSDALYIVSDSLGNISLSTLFGGTSVDYGSAIAFDGLFRTGIGGNTSSADFPVSTKVFQEVYTGQGDAFAKVIDSTAGIFLSQENFILNKNLILYPNPTNEELILANLENGWYEIEIITLEGKLINTMKTNVINQQIRLTEMVAETNGLNFIRITSKGKTETLPFIHYK